MTKYLSLFFLLVIGLIVSCTSEEPEPDQCANLSATYNGAVKTIIAEGCAYAGCHDGTGTNTIIPVSSIDYTTYAGLKASLDAGSFNARTLVSKNMPPANSVPPGSPMELTAEQLELLTCWHDAGYPEN